MEEEHKSVEKYNINPLLTVRVLVTLHSLVPGLQLQKPDLSNKANGSGLLLAEYRQAQ